MKILVVSQQYWPENWRIVDICEELVRRGNNVTVICGRPDNPDGSLKEGYRHRRFQAETHNGVDIRRVSDRPRKHGNFSLFLKYTTFVHKAKQISLKFDKDFDVVFSNQLSPIMQAIPAITFGRREKIPVLMYCYDLWPESLSARKIVDRGITKPVYRHYLKLSRRIYNSADKILVTSPAYISYLKNTCLVPEEKVSFLPQYAEDIFHTAVKPFLPNATTHNFVFAGNVGAVQDIETLLMSAKLLAGHSDISLHIVGSGSHLDRCKKMAEKLALKNVFFHGTFPLNSMPSIYEAADALIVTFSALDYLKYVIPGKLQTYMAYGKPIIAVSSGETASIVTKANCGLSVLPGKPSDIANAIAKIASMSSERRQAYGNNAKEYSKQHFDRKLFFDRLENELKTLTTK